MWDTLLTAIQQGDHRSLARAISLVENSSPGYEQLMKQLPVKDIPLIGITGAPGAGKSTLVDALIERAVDNGLQVAVLCIDPSSPFHRGALLGDRIRMSKWYSHKNVFIRSLASRGALGGLHPRIIEICEIIQSAPFNIVIIETIGVGQNEVEIAGLADCTVVVTVPESGDEIQTMKAGVMEIADLFVVNKADRPSADQFIRSLEAMLAPAFTVGNKTIPVLKTIGTQKSGIEELYQALLQCLKKEQDPEKKAWLLTERAYRLIELQRMKHIDKMELNQRIAQGLRLGKFNLYQFVQPYLTGI